MLTKPFRRIVRPFPEEVASHWPERFPYYRRESSGYMEDQDYASGRIEAVRSYFTLERDLVRLFEYVEPADSNLGVFSIRLHEMLLRAAIEVEANCKAILVANGYRQARDWNISDYRKVDKSSRLSDYELKVIIWRSAPRVIRPFAEWAQGSSTAWYLAYNAVKHDRHRQFEQANIENTVTAVAAVRAILFSQFYINAFSPRQSVVMHSFDSDHFMTFEDSIFGLKPPQTWTDPERYDFDWSALEAMPDRFAQFPF